MGLATDIQSKLKPMSRSHFCWVTLMLMAMSFVDSTLFAQTYASFGDKRNVTIAPPTPIAQGRLVTDPAVRPASFQSPQSPSPVPQPSQFDSGSLPTRLNQLSSQHPTPALVNQLKNSYSRPRSERMARALVPPTRRRQEDPFGENQPMPEPQPRAVPNNTVTPRGNSFEGFSTPPPISNVPEARQEDPFGENQKPPVNPTNPNNIDPQQPPGVLPGEGSSTQDPREPVTDPRSPNQVTNPRTTPNTNPRTPQGTDPVLPNDANPRTPPTQIPGLENPNSGQPREANPDSSVRPGESVPPMQMNGYPTPCLDNSMDYDNSDPQLEVVDRRSQSSNQYRPPAAVQPSSQGGPGQYFVPAFDPIPGLPINEPLQNYTPAPGTPQPYQYPPVQYAQPYMQPRAPATVAPVAPSVANPPHAQGQVYSSVVANQSSACQGCMNQGCNGCTTDPCDPCNIDNGLSMRRGILRNLLADDCVACDQFVCPEFYFGFQGGWSDLQNMISDNDNELETEAGSAFAFSLGRINGRNLRTEIELAFRNNDISDLLFRGESQSYAGDVSTFSGMANAYWEFVDFPGGRFRPYIGGGVGFASHDVAIDGTSGGITFPASGESTSFAYQWMAGMNYRASRNLDVFVEYRFFEADSVNVQSPTVFSDPPMLGTNGGGDYNFQANNVGIGLRWKF